MQSSNITKARAMRDAYKTESEREAFEAGYDHAHGIACHNVPQIGAEIFLDGEGRITVDADNIADVHVSLCYEAEMNARCFSPWEYTAAKINDLGDGESEAAWEAYDAGVAAAIAHDLDDYDYGLEEDGE